MMKDRVSVMVIAMSLYMVMIAPIVKATDNPRPDPRPLHACCLKSAHQAGQVGQAQSQSTATVMATAAVMRAHSAHSPARIQAQPFFRPETFLPSLLSMATATATTTDKDKKDNSASCLHQRAAKEWYKWRLDFPHAHSRYPGGDKLRSIDSRGFSHEPTPDDPEPDPDPGFGQCGCSLETALLEGSCGWVHALIYQ